MNTNTLPKKPQYKKRIAKIVHIANWGNIHSIYYYMVITRNKHIFNFSNRQIQPNIEEVYENLKIGDKVILFLLDSKVMCVIPERN